MLAELKLVSTVSLMFISSVIFSLDHSCCVSQPENSWHTCCCWSVFHFCLKIKCWCVVQGVFYSHVVLNYIVLDFDRRCSVVCNYKF